jgi:TfoX/Sxy family transcriptional regulator of competence genes
MTLPRGGFMAWKKVSPEKSDILEKGLAPFDCQKRQMFGCPAYFVNNNMFAGAHQDDILIRLSETDRKEIMSLYDQAALFEPMQGRPMREYVVLPERLYRDHKEFNRWLTRSYGYASALPPKEKKPRKKRKSSRRQT